MDDLDAIRGGVPLDMPTAEALTTKLAGALLASLVGVAFGFLVFKTENRLAPFPRHHDDCPRAFHAAPCFLLSAAVARWSFWTAEMLEVSNLVARVTPVLCAGNRDPVDEFPSSREPVAVAEPEACGLLPRS